jgi:transglutaminase-like putative cysteine protease
MTSIFVGSDLSYEVKQRTSFLFQVAVATTPHQKVRREVIHMSTGGRVDECAHGELDNRMHRVVAEPGDFTLSYRAEIELSAEVVDPNELNEIEHPALPAVVLPFLNPSRYCESDRLMRFAYEEFSGVAPGHSRVKAICDWTYSHLEYTRGSTGPTITACDVILNRTGVCRDYAHVAITLCRAIGIPARYVAGYAVKLDPPDFHGFFEAFLGNRWFLFDATRLAPVGGLVRIGTGRDAADVSFATRIGSAINREMRVWAVDADPNDELLREPNTEAISTA